MIDFFSWSQAAVLSPSQCPAQRPEEGNVERVMMIPRSPVTSCTALLGGEQENWDQSRGRKAIGFPSRALWHRAWWQNICPLTVCFMESEPEQGHTGWWKKQEHWCNAFLPCFI
jgi:hypothetical protein